MCLGLSDKYIHKPEIWHSWDSQFRSSLVSVPAYELAACYEQIQDWVYPFWSQLSKGWNFILFYWTCFFYIFIWALLVARQLSGTLFWAALELKVFLHVCTFAFAFSIYYYYYYYYYYYNLPERRVSPFGWFNFCYLGDINIVNVSDS